MDTHITPVPENMARKDLLTEIRFEALVTAYDVALPVKERGVRFFFPPPPKKYPPQWFKLQFMLTLETIKYESPEIIGRMIKDAFFKLEQEINRYQDSKQ